MNITRRTIWAYISYLVLAGWLVACGQPTPTETAVSPRDVFPGEDAVPGWTPNGDAETFDSETLFDLVNGQADAFFAYNFEAVAVQSYDGPEDAVMRIEVWQLATPADAYGLFTTNVSGAPADVGNAGDADPGRRLAFWQNRYYVQVRGQQAVSDGALRAFAETMATALPIGGETPALMSKLPSEGLVDRSAIFFRQEISIQDEVWLGGENILGLSAETEGVLTRYDVNGNSIYLLLVQYPDAQAASAALAAVSSGDIADLALADANGSLLGAIFGLATPEDVRQLLDAALQ